MTARKAFAGGLATVVLLAGASRGWAIPVELKDTNDTKYFVNTDVDALVNTSNASGAVTNATYTKPVTVTSTFIAFTPWFGFTTVYTVQYELNVPLTPAFWFQWAADLGPRRPVAGEPIGLQSGDAAQLAGMRAGRRESSAGLRASGFPG